MKSTASYVLAAMIVLSAVTTQANAAEKKSKDANSFARSVRSRSMSPP